MRPQLAAYSIADLGVLFGQHPRTTRRHLPKLYRQGFPKPLAGPGHRRWSRALVDAWFGSAPAGLCAEPMPAGVVDLHAARETLRRRTETAARSA